MNLYPLAFLPFGCWFDGDFHFLIEARQQCEPPVNGEAQNLAIHKRRDVRLFKFKNFRRLFLS